MRRPFLVPLGLALAGLGAQPALAEPSAGPEGLEVGGTAATSPRASKRLQHPLLAVSQARRHLATYLGHSSHSSHSSHASHASHASHSSHFSSSSPAPALPPAPAPPVVAAPRQPPATQTRPAATPAPSTPVFLSARLTLTQEVPEPAVAGVGAQGLFSATLSGRILRWQLTVSRLSDSAAAAVIRVAPKGLIGPRLITLCEPCANVASGTLVLSTAQAAKLVGSATYVNVGTHTNPNGEIRGQIRRG
jgi:hypothetical protein